VRQPEHLLLGIDKDTRTGYLYAVSHANGTATVIKGLGKVPTTFTDKTYFRYQPRRLGSSDAVRRMTSEVDEVEELA
jgi:hypothetical protein